MLLEQAVLYEHLEVIQLLLDQNVIAKTSSRRPKTNTNCIAMSFN